MPMCLRVCAGLWRSKRVPCVLALGKWTAGRTAEVFSDARTDKFAEPSNQMLETPRNLGLGCCVTCVRVQKE